MKYLIFGAGFLGGKFDDYLGDSLLSRVDITDYEAVKGEIETHKPDAVINAAGRTGRPNIDWCEDHKLETVVSNVIGPQVLLRATQELGVYFCHLSSGCIYEGDNDGRGFSEEDAPNFYGSFYSRTKIWAEEVLREFPVLIVRVRMPLDTEKSDRNLLDKLLKYDKIISVANSITVVPDLLKVTKQLIEKKAIGIFNATNPGAFTHAELLDMYKAIVDPSYEYTVMSLEEMETVVKAPRSNCVLNSDKLRDMGIGMREVREAVRDTLEKYKKPLRF